MKKVWRVKVRCEYGGDDGGYEETFRVRAGGLQQAAEAASALALKGDKKLEAVWVAEVKFLFELDN